MSIEQKPKTEFVLMKRYVPGKPSQVGNEDMDSLFKDLTARPAFRESVLTKEGNSFICVLVPSNSETETALLKDEINQVAGWTLIERAGYRANRS